MTQITPAAKWQFSILDLLIAPCAIVVSLIASISIDLLSSDAADLILPDDWTQKGRSFVEPMLPWGTGDPVESAGIVLSLPSIASVLVVAFMLAATRTRFGIQASFFLPLSHLWITSWFLGGAFYWVFHFTHVLAIVPCWAVAWFGLRLSKTIFPAKQNHALLGFRIACWGLLAFLVTTSGHWYREYQRAIENMFDTL